MLFRNRIDAGKKLARHPGLVGIVDPIVIALPRGGVPVAAEVARYLHTSLDTLVVRKIGSPSQPELGVGAIAEGGEVLFNRRLIQQLKISEPELNRVIEVEKLELSRRVELFRKGRPLIPIE